MNEALWFLLLWNALNTIALVIFGLQLKDVHDNTKDLFTITKILRERVDSNENVDDALVRNVLLIFKNLLVIEDDITDIKSNIVAINDELEELEDV